MSRRIISLLLASLTIFALLPASAAFAQASATARLTSNQVVHPGDHTYSIEVVNKEPQLIGRTINAVTIQLPTAAANIVFRGKPPAAGSFTTVKAVTSGQSSIVTWTGGSLAPQATQTFQIPTTVKRPYRSDVAGDWLVQVSSNNMQSASAAKPPTQNDTLRSQVEALEIIPTSIRPTAPTNADNSKGVTDRSGTAGQTVTYSFDVKNYAQEALNVTGSMGSNQDADRPGGSVTKSVPGVDGVGSFSVPLILGAATTQRNTTVTANAVAPNADAISRNDTFTVQVPVDLAFTNLRPTRVRSGTASAREFTVTAAKSGGPGFDLASSELRFGSNVAALKEGTSKRFESGARTASLAYQIAQIGGNDGELNASVVTVGSDDNLANYTLNRAAGLITIDNIVPTFDLPLPVLGTNGNDAEGDKLIAATDGTRITVAGKAFGTDLEGGTLQVWLQPDVGNRIPVTVTRTQEADGIRFTGSVSGNAVAWDENATRFTAVAQIADEATNVGSAESGFNIIDQVAPVLDPNGAVVTSPTTVRVQWDDQTGVRGGCDAASWTIDGVPNQVERVNGADGEACNPRELSTDGVRILVLKSSAALGVDDLPEIGYYLADKSLARAAGMRPVKDGAANDAPNQTVTAVTDLIPPAPNVQNLERKDHQSGQREAAYFDAEEERYYTNVGGADAIEATVTGVKTGYKIQVLDGSNNVVAEYNAAPRPATSPLASEWTQDVLIPLGSADGVYTRGVRLLSTATGKASLQTITRFVIDTSLPTVGESTLSGPGEAFAYFNEKIVAGTNSNRDWFATWTLVSEGETRQVHTQVLDVQTVEGQNLTARRATFDGIDENTFQRLNFSIQNPSTTRYEDRAGNYMLDTITFDEVQ